MEIEISDNEVFEASKVLYSLGMAYGWWPNSSAILEELDQIAREEFEGVVYQILAAAAKVRAG